MQRLELGGGGRGFGKNSPPHCRQLTPCCPQPPRPPAPRGRRGQAPSLAKSTLSPRQSPRAPRAREQGWGAVHRGPPSTQSLLSTGCCRHISLPAEMMGR